LETYRKQSVYLLILYLSIAPDLVVFKQMKRSMDCNV